MLSRIAFSALAVLLLADLGWAARDLSWWMIPAALAGWYAADAMSGIVHMWMDYRPARAGVGLDKIFFYEGSRESAEYLALRAAAFSQLNPLEKIVYDFKNHHPRPDALGRRSMMHQIGSTIGLGTLPLLLLASIGFVLFPVPSPLIVLVVTFTIGATFAQYFHGTLHRDDNPWPVRLMRRLGLLMNPQDHVRHHDTLSCDFSTINGWSNPALNRVFTTLRKRGYMRDEGLIPN